MAAAPPPSPAPAPPEAPAVVGRPPSRSRRTTTWIAVGAIVAVVALVAALAAIGLGPFAPSRSPSGPGPYTGTYLSARSVADAAAPTMAHGPWSDLLVLEFASKASLILPIALVAGSNSTTCPLVSAGAAIATAPAVPGTVDAGVGSIWLFVDRNASGGLLLLTVTTGGAQEIGTIAGTASCASAFAFLTPIPGGLADSPTVDGNVAAAGGASFLADHPTANLSALLFGGVSFLSLSGWEIAYTTCPLFVNSTAIGAVFNASASADTGTVTAHAQSSVSCSSANALGLLGALLGGGLLGTGPGGPGAGATPIGAALALGAPTRNCTGSVSTTSCIYNLSVEQASSGLAPDEIALTLLNASHGDASPIASGATLLAFTGCAEASYSFATGLWSIPTVNACGSAPTAPMTAGELLEITTGPSAGADLAGGSLVVVGLPPSFTGTITVALP